MRLEIVRHALLGLSLSFTGACAATSSQRTLATGVALDHERLIVAGSQGKLLVFATHDRKPALEQIGELPTPCPEQLDVEFFGGRLYLLCANARVFSLELGLARADLGEIAATSWEPLNLPDAPAVLMFRADSALFRYEVQQPEPPPKAGIRFDGPGPVESLTIIAPSQDEAWSAVDPWTHAANRPTSNEAGDAFALPTRLHRHVQVSLMSARHCNALCRFAFADAGAWVRDTGVDDKSRTFAILTDIALVLIEFDVDGSIRASTHDPISGAHRRVRLRCRR